MSFFIYFVYIATICNTRVARNKTLDMLIYEMNNLWVAIPKYTVYFSVLRSRHTHIGFAIIPM